MMECDSQPGTGSDVNQGAMEEEKYWREYWNRYDDNVAVDHNIQRWTYETRLAMDELLKDAELNCLHHEAVEWHQKRIAHLRGCDLQQDIFNSSGHRHSREVKQELETVQELHEAA